MKITTRKVAIVGCGLVGSTTAFSLVTQGVCDEGDADRYQRGTRVWRDAGYVGTALNI